jgi:anti-sigma regulatory factor (Ser/Thr protein kinase)
LCYSTVLLTSETVTNAVVHGRSEVRVTIDASPQRLRVEVGDDDVRHPVRRPADVESLGGRGVALLDAYATTWGVDSRGDGKVVWFELHV